MNYRLLLQSAVFALEGLLLVLLLSAALHFEAARLVFLMLMVLVLGVPGLVVFKYDKPRGYLLDLVTYYGLPRAYCGCARDRKVNSDFLIDSDNTEAD